MPADKGGTPAGTPPASGPEGDLDIVKCVKVKIFEYFGLVRLFEILNLNHFESENTRHQLSWRPGSGVRAARVGRLARRGVKRGRAPRAPHTVCKFFVRGRVFFSRPPLPRGAALSILTCYTWKSGVDLKRVTRHAHGGAHGTCSGGSGQPPPEPSKRDWCSRNRDGSRGNGLLLEAQLLEEPSVLARLE